MTERDYIIGLKEKAADYLVTIGGRTPPCPDIDREAARRWDHARLGMSPATIIAMADAWLEKNAAEALKREEVAA